MSDRLIRVKSWAEFKRLADELKPSSLVYIIEQNGVSRTKELTILRLILPAQNAYYVYLDFPKENALRETEIPIRTDRTGNRHLEDEDIKQFIRREFGKDMPVFSYWTT